MKVCPNIKGILKQFSLDYLKRKMRQIERKTRLDFT